MDKPAPLSTLVERGVGLLLVAGLATVSFLIVSPFLGAVAWGAVLAISLTPTHRRLARWLGERRGLAATLLALGLILVLLVPLTSLVGMVSRGADQIASSDIELDRIHAPPPPAWVAEIPLVGPPIDKFWREASQDMRAALDRVRPYVRSAILWLISQTLSSTLAVLEFLLAIAVSAYLLVKGPAAAVFCARFLARVGNHEPEAVLNLIARTVRTVSAGIIGTAFIQATVAGIGFAIAGVPGALMLAFFVFVLCTVQVGPVLIGLPLAAWYWGVEAEPGWAIFLAAWTVMVTLIDNFTKPLLMGRGLPVPLWLTMLGVLGGVLSMGLIGIFLGPTLLAVGYTLFVAWVVEGPPPEDA